MDKILLVINASEPDIFKKSNADILIRTVDLPIFITHH